jgi:hypothetical protein
MSIRRKSLPPYGKKVIRAIKDGQITNGVNIFTCWKHSKNFPNAICFPSYAQPQDFNWSFLINQRISIINIDGISNYEALKRLAVLLVQSGSAEVGLIDPDHSLQWYIPDIKETV